MSSLHGRCQIVLFCMMVSNCPRCQIVLGVKLSSLPSWCQIVLLAIMVSNCPKCHIVLGVKLSAVSNGPRISSPNTSSQPSHHRYHRPHQQDQVQGFDLGNNYSLFILRCPLQGPARFSYDFGRGSCSTPLSNLESCTLDSR